MYTWFDSNKTTTNTGNCWVSTEPNKQYTQSKSAYIQKVMKPIQPLIRNIYIQKIHMSLPDWYKTYRKRVKTTRNAEIKKPIQPLIHNINTYRIYTSLPDWYKTYKCVKTGRGDAEVKHSLIPTCEFLFECNEAEAEMRDSTDLTVRRRLEMEGATSASVTTESWSGNNKGKLGVVADKCK